MPRACRHRMRITARSGKTEAMLNLESEASQCSDHTDEVETCLNALMTNRRVQRQHLYVKAPICGRSGDRPILK